LNPLLVSQVLLWIVVLVLLLVVWALARQIGVLHERIAPMGALITDAGPRVGDAAPILEAPALSGELRLVGAPSARHSLLFFLSPTCPVCKKLLPALRSVAQAERDWLDITLASDGEMPEHLAFYREAQLAPFPYVLSSELGTTWRVSRLPYAVLLDERGTVRAKGLINTREHLDSLFTALELGVGNVQKFVELKRQAG
jgi:methylamine dehydrogenase accessory protein MauD